MKVINYIQSFLKNNKWLLFFLFSQTALLFIILSDSYNEDTTRRVISNCLYFIIVAFAFCLMSGWIRKAAIITYQTLSFVPNIIVLGWYSINKGIMKSTDFWVIFDTNPGEAGGFLTIVPVNAIIWCVVYSVISIILCVIACKESNNKTSGIKGYISSLCGIGIWIGVSVVLPFRAHVPLVDFYKSFHNFMRERKYAAEFYESRKYLTIDSECYLPNDVKKTYIIVIGESATRSHYGLYGYPRNTTPRLDSIKNELICYDNVISPAIQTLTCMKDILTFSNYESPDMYKQEANIIEILRDAKYKTYWFDNQGVGGIDTFTPTSYRAIAKMCDEFFVNQEYMLDTILVNLVKRNISDTALNKVFFLHLNGSHFPYEIRYSEEFNVFDDQDIYSPYKEQLTDKQICIINEYDNSILYNEYILSTLISIIRQEEGICALLYFPDHGEEVFDNQLYSGRSFEKLSAGMCEIPCILWINEEAKMSMHLNINEHIPYCTDDIIHSIMDLTGTTYTLKDTTRSMFSSEFSEKERIVQGRTYESIIKENK